MTSKDKLRLIKTFIDSMENWNKSFEARSVEDTTWKDVIESVDVTHKLFYKIKEVLELK